MRLYRFNYHANHEIHVGTQWAMSSYDVERSIIAQSPNATGIVVWVA